MTQRQETAQINGTWQNVQTEEFMNNEKAAIEQVLHADDKHPYHKPVLVELGDLRTMTLSPTPDDAEESGTGTFYYEGPGDLTTDQFEGGTSRRAESSGGGRSGRS